MISSTMIIMGDVKSNPAGEAVVIAVAELTPARTLSRFSNGTFVHDPQATLDYGIDWTGWLPVGSVIDNSAWVSDGVTVVETLISDDKTVVVVSGGTPGSSHKLINTVTYANGMSDERTITLKVRDQ